MQLFYDFILFVAQEQSKMPSAVTNSTNGTHPGGKPEERRVINLGAIPKEWILDPALLHELQTPWETSKNNMLALDLPQKSGILTSRELEITGSYTVQSLLKELASGAITSVEVVTAFCKRAAIAHQVVILTLWNDGSKRTCG